MIVLRKLFRNRANADTLIGNYRVVMQHIRKSHIRIQKDFEYIVLNQFGSFFSFIFQNYDQSDSITLHIPHYEFCNYDEVANIETEGYIVSVYDFTEEL